MATNYVLMSTQGALDLLNLKRVAVNAAGYYLGLFTGTPVFSVPPVMADITECSFAGYARQAVTNFGAAVTNASPPNADSVDVVHTFSCTATGSTNNYGGSFLADASVAGNLLLVTKGNTGSAVNFDAAGKFVTVQPRLTEASYQAYP
jgi:hypothetical protein